MCGVTRLDKIKKDRIKGSLEVADTAGRMKENGLEWYGRVERMNTDEIIKRARELGVDGRQGREVMEEKRSGWT